MKKKKLIITAVIVGITIIGTGTYLKINHDQKIAAQQKENNAKVAANNINAYLNSKKQQESQISTSDSTTTSNLTANNSPTTQTPTDEQTTQTQTTEEETKKTSETTTSTPSTSQVKKPTTSSSSGNSSNTNNTSNKPTTTTPAASKPTTTPTSNKPAATTPTTTTTNNSFSTTAPKLPTTYNVEYLTQVENDIVALCNQERAKVGASPLSNNETLRQVGRYKSDEMLQYNYFDHTSPITKYAPWDLAKTFGWTFGTFGENIWMTQVTGLDSNNSSAVSSYKSSITAQNIMNSWMNSEGHKANILNKSYTKIGVGIAFSNSGKTYATQEFSN